MITKEDLEKKLEIVHRQMKHCGYEDYLELLLERERIFFSDNVELYPKAIHDIDGLISNTRAWDDMVCAKEDKFIKEFKNFDEYFHFARELVRDINAYNEERLKNK